MDLSQFKCKIEQETWEEFDVEEFIEEGDEEDLQGSCPSEEWTFDIQDEAYENFPDGDGSVWSDYEDRMTVDLAWQLLVDNPDEFKSHVLQDYVLDRMRTIAIDVRADAISEMLDMWWEEKRK